MQKYFIPCPYHPTLRTLHKPYKKYKPTHNLLIEQFLPNKILKINENEFLVGFV
jgi:hypothetical protein